MTDDGAVIGRVTALQPADFLPPGHGRGLDERHLGIEVRVERTVCRD
jgi:hypothetical protein